MTSPAKVVAILGSARPTSNTLKALEALSPFSEYELLDLLQFRIDHYSYSDLSANSDDFLSLIDRIIKFDVIIFATPVYWYSMSGRMKVFFDRLTELITTNKKLGRGLKDKHTYLIACGTDEYLPDGFEIPFKRTSEYFEMQFMKSFYLKIAD